MAPHNTGQLSQSLSLANEGTSVGEAKNQSKIKNL